MQLILFLWKLSKSACVQGRVTDRLSGVDAPDGAGPAPEAVAADQDGDDDGRQKK